MTWRIIEADCIEAMAAMDADSVDAIVTDPPYGLEFMGKEWDRLQNRRDNQSDKHNQQPDTTGRGSWAFGGTPSSEARVVYRAGRQAQTWHQAWATVALRVLKPGGHLLAFGGTRTYHRLACGLEDAGFEIRDCLAWLYGSGFPKSLDVSKAIDKAAGAERDVIGQSQYAARRPNPMAGTAYNYNAAGFDPSRDLNLTAPATPESERWQGWGTALKPSHEPVVWATKPVAASDVLATIGSQLDEVEAAWQAQGADQTIPTGAEGASSDQTDTSQSESVTPISLSIVTSWRACWAELCELTSTSTTAITTRATTDLRTLSSCLSEITRESTPAQSNLRPSESSLVSAADHLFGATVLSLRGTLALSALGLATANTPHSLREGLEPEPAFEPIVLARKPLVGTVAGNVLEHGTGALNIDATRIAMGEEYDPTKVQRTQTDGNPETWRMNRAKNGTEVPTYKEGGRWPANVILDEEAARLLDEQSGESLSSGGRIGKKAQASVGNVPAGSFHAGDPGFGDFGGASRFFYVAKADTEERNRGLEHLPDRSVHPPSGDDRVWDIPGSKSTARPNHHPTVKPVEVMRWLCRLVTPSEGLVLDPFAGSGTTGIAALREGFSFIGIERDADYVVIARDRIIGDAPLFNVPSEQT